MCHAVYSCCGCISASLQSSCQKSNRNGLSPLKGPNLWGAKPRLSASMDTLTLPVTRADPGRAACLMDRPRGHNSVCNAAQTLLCGSEPGLSCPNSGGRRLTHVATVSARFQSVVSTRRSRRDVRFSPDYVCFTPNSGHSEAHAGLPVLTRLGHWRACEK